MAKGDVVMVSRYQDIETVLLDTKYVSVAGWTTIALTPPGS
jgi:hypothetical protein